MKPKIAIYTIMKNEAANVADWIETTADADDVVVLDTGSKDGTPDLLDRGSVEVHRAWYDPFRFDDARNAALALVAPSIDLCLRLDADERLPPDWRAVIEDGYRSRFARYRYQVVNHGRGWRQSPVTTSTPATGSGGGTRPTKPSKVTA